MKLTKPNYYDTFRCIASACPDSCCKEWDVQVDDEKAAFYRSLPGALGDRLREVLQDEDGETMMLIENGRCPMWRADGLCRIQAELGQSALCDTCREFPRLTHDYGDFVEQQLELSCPEAARLILEGDDGVTTVNLPGDGEGDYDRDAMAVLLRSRECALCFLKETDLPVGQALAVLLFYGYAVQAELDGGEVAALRPKDDLDQCRAIASGGDAGALLQFYRELEILTDQWNGRLAAPLGSDWQPAHRKLARYFVSRYWLQAVSDYDLVGRVKLVVCSCLVIKLLGGNVGETAQLYSKEIENDADNVDALLDGAYTAPALTDAKLLDLLL